MTDYFMQVSDYVEGRLSSADKKAFETEMSYNEELRRAVENNDVMDLTLGMLWEDDARQVAERAHKEFGETNEETQGSQKQDANIFSFKKGLAVAASLAALLIIGYLIVQNVNNPNPKLYAEFYSPYMGDQSRGSNTNSFTALCDQGHFLMDNEQFSEAIEAFKKSIESNEDCMQKSQWYLSLSYLRNREEHERDLLLQEIVNSKNHEYNTIAKKLVARLK